MTITEFCERYSVRRAHYTQLVELGDGPKTTKVGARIMITDDDAEAWRVDQEARMMAYFESPTITDSPPPDPATR